MEVEKTRGDHRIFKSVFIECSCPDLCHGRRSQKCRFQSVSADCGKWIFRYIVWPVSSGIVEKIKKAGRALRKRICSVIEFPGKIQKKIRNFALTIRKFCDKIKRWRNFINHPRTRAAISLVWKDAKKLLRHIFPTKVTGMITFGCEDPAVTGTVLAVMGMTIPFHKNKVTVKPLFDGENILEGEIMLKGRIYGVILLKTAVELYFNKNIKYVIHRWRHKEVKHGERE